MSVCVQKKVTKCHIFRIVKSQSKRNNHKQIEGATGRVFEKGIDTKKEP